MNFNVCTCSYLFKHPNLYFILTVSPFFYFRPPRRFVEICEILLIGCLNCIDFYFQMNFTDRVSNLKCNKILQSLYKSSCVTL